MNSSGHALKKVLKSIPLKKIPEVDEIFDNVRKVDTESLRISTDTEAGVRIGEFVRGRKIS